MPAAITANQVSSRVDTLEEKVDSHDRFINGNGTKGAKSRIDLLETSQGEIIKRLDTMTARITGLLFAVLGAVIVYLITDVLPAVMGHLRP